MMYQKVQETLFQNNARESLVPVLLPPAKVGQVRIQGHGCCWLLCRAQVVVMVDREVACWSAWSCRYACGGSYGPP